MRLGLKSDAHTNTFRRYTRVSHALAALGTGPEGYSALRSLFIVPYIVFLLVGL